MSDSIPIHGVDHIPTYLPEQRNSQSGREKDKTDEDAEDPLNESNDSDESEDKKNGRCEKGIGGHVDLEA